MSVYLRAKFKVSSATLMNSGQGGGGFTPSPQNEPLKSPPKLGIMCHYNRKKHDAAFCI